MVPVLVSAREKALDLAAYNRPTGDVLAADHPVTVPAQATDTPVAA